MVGVGEDEGEGEEEEGGNRGFGQRMGCFQCVQAGLFCNHCYTCGEENHKFFECPVSQALRETENEGGIRVEADNNPRGNTLNCRHMSGVPSDMRAGEAVQGLW